jgi:phenylalanyl-tRNA synthetase alpha chain
MIGLAMMVAEIDQIRTQALAAISAASTGEQLEEFRVRYLSRKGAVAALFQKLGNLPEAERPAAGQLVNDLRDRLQDAYAARKKSLETPRKDPAGIDLTLPGRSVFTGSKHPLTQTLDEIKSIFASMGFSVADGPEIEDDFHNFGALNFPADHPARDMQDTFFLSKKALLRTHTSPVQIRVMEQQQPPVRVIIPGKVYRNEAVSPRSLCIFHQVEGLYVDKNVSFSELKGTLASFVRQFYGSDIRYKFRPTFFPFTEPSADIYISCFICEGKGCRMCKLTGWLEILGCGMVHPAVFRSVGYDPELYAGYAFGMGIERIAALRYGVDDLRLFYENDVRFLAQF